MNAGRFYLVFLCNVNLGRGVRVQEWRRTPYANANRAKRWADRLRRTNGVLNFAAVKVG